VRSCEMRQGSFDSWCACSAKKRHPALHSARNTDQSECKISPYHTIERLLKLCRGTTRLILCYGELNLSFSLYVVCLPSILLVSQHEPWIQPARQYVLGTLVCALAQTCLMSPTIFTQVSKLVTFDHNRHCFPTAWYLDAPPKVPCPCLTLALGFDHTFPDITPSGYHITTPESSTLSIYQTIRISKACQGHTIGIYQYRFITTYSYMTTRNTKYARCSQSKSLHPSRILID
jgi:hypothetical protein